MEMKRKALNFSDNGMSLMQTRKYTVRDITPITPLFLSESEILSWGFRKKTEV